MKAPVIGDGGGWWSFVHVDDAAQATALAVERGRQGFTTSSTTNRRQCARLPEFARLLGAKPPYGIPRWLGRIAAGEHLVVMMTESRAGSNRKARSAFGWVPAHPSWRQGFAELLDAEFG